jgi:tetratricopeptide (TPR) repeat protein
VQAIATAVRLLTISRDVDHIASLEGVVAAVRSAVQDPYEQLHILLADAWIHSASNHPDHALGQLQQGVSLAKDRGFRSSLTVRMLVGLGNTLAVLGRYDEALVPLLEAESMARHLDNDTLVAECSTQLATVHGRLGERLPQIDWARRASARFPTNDWSPGAMGARYELGLGLALEGRSPEAHVVASGLLKRAPADRPLWVRQAAFLCAADVLMLAGHPQRAIRSARDGLLLGDWLLLNNSYAGQFARWTAMITIQDEEPRAGLARLAAAFPNPRTLHAKDRTEFHAAKALLMQRAGIVPMAEWRAARDGLGALPPGISSAVRGFGFHPDQQGLGADEQSP